MDVITDELKELLWALEPESPFIHLRFEDQLFDWVYKELVMGAILPKLGRLWLLLKGDFV